MTKTINYEKTVEALESAVQSSLKLHKPYKQNLLSDMDRKARERKKSFRLQQVPIPARDFHFSLTPYQLTKEAMSCKIRNVNANNNEGKKTTLLTNEITSYMVDHGQRLFLITVIYVLFIPKQLFVLFCFDFVII